MIAPDAPAGRSIRLLVVDDHPAVREGLALLVSADGISVVAEAECARDALAALAHGTPDLAVVDLSLEDEDGLDLVAALVPRNVPVLVYSMHQDARHVQEAFAAGALGYVTKAEFRGVLVEAIRTVAAKKRFVSPRAAIALAESATPPALEHPLAPLSTKERQVYDLVGHGEGSYEIAKAMQISTHTVESYYARIQQKLGLTGMYELRRHAIDHRRQRAR